MPNWGNAFKGATSGAVGGAVLGGSAGLGIGAIPGALVGGGLGFLGGLFGSGDSGPSEDELRKQAAYWDEMAKKAPDQNPDWNAQLSSLAEQGKRGLDPQSRLALMESLGQAGQFAHGANGAALQQEQMRGGGVANSGQTLASQESGTQNAAMRAQFQGGQIASANDARKIQAQQQFLNQMGQNQNFYAMLEQGRTGQSQHAQDYAERQQSASAPNMGGALSGIGAAGMTYLNSKAGAGGFDAAGGYTPQNGGTQPGAVAPVHPSAGAPSYPLWSPTGAQQAPSDALARQESSQDPTQGQRLTKTSGR